MGSPTYLNKAEVEQLKKNSCVIAEEYPYEWKDGILTIHASLGVNDVYGFVVK